MKRRRIPIGLLALGLLLALAVGLGKAQGPGSGEEYRPEGIKDLAQGVGGYIPIQGRLTDTNGNPLNGTYSIRFRLYDDPEAVAELCSYTEVVPVTNGQFMVYIGGVCALPGVFTGAQLYLGIQVEDDDEMVPRQPIYPVPYAMSLQPGAKIQGSVGGSGLWVENTQSTGNVYGVRGSAASPDGYGGYFDNGGGGYALGVGGGMKMTVNATGAQPINVGDRYRDNAIVAWGKMSGGNPGSIQAEFGITAVDHYNTGCYKIYLDSSAAESASLIPMAIAEIDSAPVGAGKIRIVSVNQLETNIFNVYINDGNGNLVDNDFILMVTAR